MVISRQLVQKAVVCLVMMTCSPLVVLAQDDVPLTSVEKAEVENLVMRVKAAENGEKANEVLKLYGADPAKKKVLNQALTVLGKNLTETNISLTATKWLSEWSTRQKEPAIRMVKGSSTILCMRDFAAPVLYVPASSTCGSAGSEAKGSCVMQINCHSYANNPTDFHEKPTSFRAVAACMGKKAYNPELKATEASCPPADVCAADQFVQGKPVAINKDIVPSGGSGGNNTGSTPAVQSGVGQ
ncbi:hypothetical protein WDW86_21270 [Bdellovibrionota bacterium FG-2]